MTAARLARAEIRALKPYITAAQQDEAIRLNANESPYPPDAQRGMGLNRYPAIRPAAVAARLALLFSVREDSILPTRGSSEAIDLLLRAFCRPYSDNVIVTSPGFSMYRVYAEIQGADVITVALEAAGDFSVEPHIVLDAHTPRTKIVFLCSPNNPCGQRIAPDAVLAIAEACADQSLVVVDEAYIEFSEADSVASNLDDYDNLVVLRTLSKAWGLAGARCGAVIAGPDIIELLCRITAPYAFSSPAMEFVLECLTEAQVEARARLIQETIGERERLRERLFELPAVDHVWPSDSNFLLVRFADLTAVRNRLKVARILIRDFSDEGELRNCARITIGSVAENDRLLAALAAVREPRQ